MLDYDDLIKRALDSGFTNAGPLDVATLEFMPQVRDMCASDRCRSYNKSWACPPAIGTLEEMRDKVTKYSKGLLVQTVKKLNSTFDWKTMEQTGKDQAANLLTFCDNLSEDFPNLLALGAGTCTRCKTCAYLDGEPCRFPDKLIYSMEACGLFVSKVCKANDLAYNYGSDHVAYTGCVLLE
ncbi:DUF2284 domain-containing protein [Oscillospiraceae bacterium CM]|nr:DUF2284 domain-containing protein [Oscillospiraceae bacterium CM]